MTFLFLGLDGFDYRLCEEYEFNDKIEDTPVQFNKMVQNLPNVISEKGEGDLNTGHWTFYVWGAIASGQVLTPEMRQEHPHRNNVEYPLKLKYLCHAPKSLLRYVKGRLKRRPRYKSFAWDDFKNVKVINYPIHLPEYNQNSELMRDDATSRDYGPLELDLLKTEINNALRKNYDAIFVVTRMVDCICHGATSPYNYGSEDFDEWFQQNTGQSFEDFHESGMDIRDFAEREGELDVEDDHRMTAVEMKQQVLDHVEESYDKAAELLNAVNWEQVDEHVVVSDHGFDSLGAGSVNAHGRNGVISCSFGYWRKMSGFIRNWREALENKMQKTDYDKQGEEFEGDKSEEEKIKEELEALGYNT